MIRRLRILRMIYESELVTPEMYARTQKSNMETHYFLQFKGLRGEVAMKRSMLHFLYNPRRNELAVTAYGATLYVADTGECYEWCERIIEYSKRQALIHASNPTSSNEDWLRENNPFGLCIYVYAENLLYTKNRKGHNNYGI